MAAPSNISSLFFFMFRVRSGAVPTSSARWRRQVDPGVTPSTRRQRRSRCQPDAVQVYFLSSRIEQRIAGIVGNRGQGDFLRPDRGKACFERLVPLRCIERLLAAAYDLAAAIQQHPEPLAGWHALLRLREMSPEYLA